MCSLYESGYYCGNSMCVNRKLVVVSVGKNFPLFINHRQVQILIYKGTMYICRYSDSIQMTMTINVNMYTNRNDSYHLTIKTKN